MTEHVIARVRFPLPTSLGGYFDGEIIFHRDERSPYQPSRYSELRGSGLMLNCDGPILEDRIFVPAAGCEMCMFGEEIDLKGSHSIRLASLGEVKLDTRLCF